MSRPAVWTSRCPYFGQLPAHDATLDATTDPGVAAVLATLRDHADDGEAPPPLDQ